MIKLKTQAEIEIIAEGGKILAEVLNQICQLAEKGNVSTLELDSLAYDLIIKANGRPSFKGYLGYPGAVCTSINQEVVHGIPSKNRVLKDGDIIGLDIGMKYKGLYTDMAYTVAVGEIDPEIEKLRQVCKQSLAIALEQVREGNHINDIGRAIEGFINKQDFNYGIVSNLTGHGVGYDLHEDPMIANFAQNSSGAKMKEGLVIAIEPMINLGTADVYTAEDDWTVITADNKHSAHFEKTVALSKDGFRELTPFIYEK